MKFYHGTDYTSGHNIIRHGFGMTDTYGNYIHPQTIWTCSDPFYTYLVKDDSDDTPDINNEAFRTALEAGQIAAAFNISNNRKIIIFEITIPDNYSNEYVEHDTSCGNSNTPDDFFQIENKSLCKLIRSGMAKVKIHTAIDAFEPYLLPFYIAHIPKENFMHNDIRLTNRILPVIRNEDCNFMYDHFIGNCSDIKTRSLKRKEIENW